MIYWEQRKLISCLSLLKDGTHGTHKDYPSGPLLLSAKNIKNGRVYYDETDRRISYKDFEKIHRNFTLQIGDILLTIVGSIGETALLKDSFEITFQRSVAFLRVKDNILPEFLMSEFNTDRFRNELEDRKSTSAQPGIYLGDLGKIPVFVSKNPAEQRRVGSYFESLDHLITLHQSKSFGHILEVIVSCTLSWEQCKLGEVFNFYYGVGNNNPSNGGQYPVFGAGGIQGGYTKYNAENSIIIGHMGDAGCVSWGEGKHFVTYNGTITKPKDDVFSAKFGYYLLLNMNLRKYRGGSGLPFLTYDMLTEMETKRPNSRFETQKIANYFSYLDHLITLHQLEPFQLIFKAIAYRIIDYAKSKPPRCRKYTGLILFIKYYV